MSSPAKTAKSGSSPATTGKAKYRRILLKISGEILAGDSRYGLDGERLTELAGEIRTVHELGVEVGLVIGGGNIFRGLSGAAEGMDRVNADYMGMLSTVINSLAMQDCLEHQGLFTRVMTAIKMEEIAEPYIRRRAMRHMEKGRVVIFAGGTGNPYMSTDTAAALRGLETGVDALLMAKNNVDGVYDADPNHTPNAKKFDHLTHHEALSLRLQALDSTALSLCMDNEMPIAVFNLFVDGNLSKVLSGQNVGTLITASRPAE